MNNFEKRKEKNKKLLEVTTKEQLAKDLEAALKRRADKLVSSQKARERRKLSPEAYEAYRSEDNRRRRLKYAADKALIESATKAQEEL